MRTLQQLVQRWERILPSTRRQRMSDRATQIAHGNLGTDRHWAIIVSTQIGSILGHEKRNGS